MFIFAEKSRKLKKTIEKWKKIWIEGRRWKCSLTKIEPNAFIWSSFHQKKKNSKSRPCPPHVSSPIFVSFSSSISLACQTFWVNLYAFDFFRREPRRTPAANNRDEGFFWGEIISPPQQFVNSFMIRQQFTCKSSFSFIFVLLFQVVEVVIYFSIIFLRLEVIVEIFERLNST